MPLEERIARLIAVGASVAGNCQPCLDVNVRKALEAGSNSEQIAQALAIGKLVRKGAASSVDAFITELEASAVSAGVEGMTCDCGLPGRAS